MLSGGKGGSLYYITNIPGDWKEGSIKINFLAVRYVSALKGFIIMFINFICTSLLFIHDVLPQTDNKNADILKK
jgi:hypothetical protein